MPGEVTRSFPGRDHRYDVLVVGAGLCGSEAAYTCARAGLDTLLITTSLDTVYNLFGEGAALTPPPDTLLHQLHSECADPSGYARTWALHRAAKAALEHIPGLHLLQSSVSTLDVEDGSVVGVGTWEGVPRRARRTALCTGSFLGARLLTGDLSEVAGRLSEMAYDDLYEHLVGLGFRFEALEKSVSPTDSAPGYRVRCQQLASAELSETRLSRLANLYAAGFCTAGDKTYEAAALEGKALAEQLIRSLA